MKILEKNGKFEKVPNDFIAETKVKQHGWRYATRTEWRNSTRPSKTVEVIEVPGLSKVIDKTIKKIKK